MMFWLSLPGLAILARTLDEAPVPAVVKRLLSRLNRTPDDQDFTCLWN